MKKLIVFQLFIAVLAFACNSNSNNDEYDETMDEVTQINKVDTSNHSDHIDAEKEKSKSVPVAKKEKPKPDPSGSIKSSAEKLPRWFSFYAARNPNFSPNGFVLKDTFLNMDFMVLDEESIDPGFEKYRIACPDGSKQLDIYGYGHKIKTKNNGKVVVTGGPDSEAALYGITAGKKQRLIFCGTACHIEDAVWLDDQTIIIAGNSNLYGDKFKPALWFIDLRDNTLVQFEHPNPLPDKYDSYITSAVFVE